MRKVLLTCAVVVGISLTLMARQAVNSRAHVQQNNAQPVSASIASADVKTPEEITPAKVATPVPVYVEVKPGESLTSIAEANQTTTQRLYDANPEISNPSLLNVGQKIRIPLATEAIATRPMPAPAPLAVNKPAVVSNAPAVASGSVWDHMSQCEAGGNWARNSGNGYYGGLQFSLSTWRAVGGQGLPSDNSREEQIARAEILLARSGWGQWPACARKLGLL